MKKHEAQRQLVRTREFLEERAWAQEDEVFADIAGKKKRRRSNNDDTNGSMSKAREASVFSHASSERFPTIFFRRPRTRSWCAR